MPNEPRIQDRETIKRVLAYALRLKAGIKWPRNSEGETEIAADRILDHLALSNVRMQMGSPGALHSTPAPYRFNLVRAARI